MQRPPHGMAVTEIFQAWLPAAFASSGRAATADAPIVRARIAGAGGGEWDVRAEEDGLAVRAPGRTPPDLLLRQSVADFQAALVKEPDLPELLPPGWSVLDLLFLDPRDVDLLRQVSGRILVEVEGRRRRRWALDVAFGKAGVDAGRPRTTIRVDGATFEGVCTGSLPPMQPLMDGRIKIEGDRALAMQILLLLGNRLTRK